MQPSLFDLDPLSFDRTFSRLERIHLDETAWIDVAPGWVSGSDALFRTMAETLPWAQRTRFLYEQQRIEPRLTAGWHAGSDLPSQPPILEEMRAALSARYGVQFDSAGFNLYRDGRDSVAWHRDEISNAHPPARRRAWSPSASPSLPPPALAAAEPRAPSRSATATCSSPAARRSAPGSTPCSRSPTPAAHQHRLPSRHGRPRVPRRARPGAQRSDAVVTGGGERRGHRRRPWCPEAHAPGATCATGRLAEGRRLPLPVDHPERELAAGAAGRGPRPPGAVPSLVPHPSEDDLGAARRASAPIPRGPPPPTPAPPAAHRMHPRAGTMPELLRPATAVPGLQRLEPAGRGLAPSASVSSSPSDA